MIVSLITAGVGLALDAYAERHVSSSRTGPGRGRRVEDAYQAGGYGGKEALPKNTDY